MNVNLFDHIDIDKNNTNVPNGINYEESVRDYDNQIAAKGGIDLQILGLGSDGHIAFNEPNTPFDSLTHVTELTEMTIQDNSRFFASIDEVPTKAITMGLQSIMNAKKIVLLATGKSKANAVRELLHGEISEEYPCTILQKHPNVVIYVDEEIEL
jgi:glucosamine-6-phosphate deaminase